MQRERGRKRKGNAVVEFALILLPLATVILGTLEIGRVAWLHQSVATAVKVTARSASVRGAKCADVSPNCRRSVGDLVATLRKAAVGVDPGQLSLVLVAGESTRSCAPVTACVSDATAWPDAPNNGVGQTITVRASLAVSPLSWILATQPGSLQLKSAAREVIQF